MGCGEREHACSLSRETVDCYPAGTWAQEPGLTSRSPSETNILPMFKCWQLILKVAEACTGQIKQVPWPQFGRKY